MTTDGIAIIVTFLLLAVIFLALKHWMANSDRRRAEMTEEEYENRKRGPNLLGAGMMAFDQMIRSDLKTAIEYRQDQEQGQIPSDKQQGEKLPESEAGSAAKDSDR